MSMILSKWLPLSPVMSSATVIWSSAGCWSLSEPWYTTSSVWEIFVPGVDKNNQQLNYFPANWIFYLLVNFANSLDPDQARQNAQPNLDPCCLSFWWYSWKTFLETVNFENLMCCLIQTIITFLFFSSQILWTLYFNRRKRGVLERS